MSFSQRMQELRSGLHPTFWVANGMELFERRAYYGQAIILGIYLRDTLHFSEIQAGELSSVFGGLIYLLPIFAGTLADKFGFRKAFSVAFFVLMIGYALLGYAGTTGVDAATPGFPLFWVVMGIMVFTAFGGSFIKPSVLGTVAVASKENVRSLGFAIYYAIVNVGAFFGPNIAHVVRQSFGVQYVYVVSAASCALMLGVNLLFYREVKDESKQLAESLGKKMLNLFLVLGNLRFIAFLLIFSLYWIMFWQIFIVVPFYVTDFISRDASFEFLSSLGALTIIVLQLPVNLLTKGLSPRQAIMIGFVVSTLSWLIIAIHPSFLTIGAGVVMWSIGEMTQAPRYYEYISQLAPRGQQALFQGYAFLPIAIAWGFGGTFGGWLYATYARQGGNPTIVWIVIFGIGVIATVLMAVYNMVVRAQEPVPGRER